ncbi:hypothetical protein [Zavarzinella formosa]|uniref:hypothetical protein n=1 Tax=Zavarzinella formosa TaxID=360055 RepID=UPI00030F779E|nr:hypothetical protein [Zavarzinella formosa]
MADVYLLKERTIAQVMETVAKLGEPSLGQTHRITPTTPPRVVKCGDLQGTLPDGTTPYYACSDVQGLNPSGEWENLIDATGWMVSAGKDALQPGRTYMAVVGPLWTPYPATETKQVFIAAAGETGDTEIVHLDPSGVDDEGLIAGKIVNFGPGHTDMTDGEDVLVLLVG